MSWKKTHAEELVNKVLAECVTDEQLKLLTSLYDYNDLSIREEILDTATLMKPRYSIKKSMEIAKQTIQFLNLDNPTINDRLALRHLFTRKLLKG